MQNITFKTKTENGKRLIFCLVRKKYVILTPEEGVRQQVIAWLVKAIEIPINLIAVEKEVKLNELKKRFDILVYNKNHQPLILVECKGPEVPIRQAAVDQVGRYNLVLKVPYLMVTNGEIQLNFRISFLDNTFESLQELPKFLQL